MGGIASHRSPPIQTEWFGWVGIGNTTDHKRKGTTVKAVVTGKMIAHVFDSTVEAIDRMDARVAHSYQSSTDNSASQSWDLEAGWEGSLEMGKLGWSDPAEDVRTQAAEVRHEAQAIVDRYKVEPIFGVAGSMVDMARVMAGEPECMIDFPQMPDRGAGDVIRIVVGAAASCAIDARDMMRRGVAVVALTECILATGRNAEVWVEGTHVREGNRSVTWLVKVKSADHSIEVENLLAWIAHPMAFRRLGFGLVERMGDKGDTWIQGVLSGGYGMAATTNWSARKEPLAEAIGGTVDVDIPPPGQSLGNRPEVKNPIKWIESTLEKLAG